MSSSSIDLQLLEHRVDRLNQAVSYLQIRDVNVLNANSSGPDGNEALRETFLGLMPILQPAVFCDVGANDGDASLEMRGILPACEIYAFEANPEIFSRNVARVTGRGISYRNLAISDAVGTVQIHVPRTLSRAFVDGKIVEATVVEAVDTGKASLLFRDEDATYNHFDVEAASLDVLFATKLAEPEVSFVLWIDVEGSAENVLMGSKAVLEKTTAVFIECENYAFWQGGSTASGVATLLIDAGFIPVARDREYDDKQFNMLFVAGRAIDKLAPLLFDSGSRLRACFGHTGGTSKRDLPRPLPNMLRALVGRVVRRALPPLSDRHIRLRSETQNQRIDAGVNSSPPLATLHDGKSQSTITCVAEYMQTHIPIFVPCFNNPTYTSNMIEQLRKRGFKKIILLDGGSTFPKMRYLLASCASECTVVTLSGNPGPRHLLLNPSELSLLPRRIFA